LEFSFIAKLLQNYGFLGLKHNLISKMQTIVSVSELKNVLSVNYQKSIGFVPTMGALHSGHIQLVKRALTENDIVVCSVFVNPTQFNNPEDLKKYPRTLEADQAMLAEAGCHILFAPTVEEMYPTMPALKFDFGNLEHIMEGKFRPGHFNGVGIVVSKLFHMVSPSRAYFGQKDIQQVAVVNRLINDLSFQIELVVCETIRETDGLAMSSRNRRLSPEARAEANRIYASLELGKSLLLKGESVENVHFAVENFYKALPSFTLEYYEITDFETLESITKISIGKRTAIVIAAFLDGVRLIDNLIF
jgi:pantoate--beta-alanine ligase